MKKILVLKLISLFAMALILSVSMVSSFTYGEEKKTAAGGVEPIININKASAEEIAKLSGIGEKTAKLIVEYREKNGGFKKPEDIKKVKGVGKKLYEKIKGNITVEDETEKMK